MIQAVVTDFGGVLTSPLIQSFMAYQEETGVDFAHVGAAMGRIAERDGEHPLYALERGHISEVDFYARIESELGTEGSFLTFRERYFKHLQPNSRMVAYMRELRGRGLRLAILTNNVREWEPLWRAKVPEVDELFELVVDSAFVGMRKPEREIYELTLERLRLSAEECAFVDDLEVNCEAAARLGMHAVLFRDAEQAIAEVEALLPG